MPKLILMNNVVLLVCFSALAGAGLPVLTGSGEGLTSSSVCALTIAAAVTAVVMLITELWSGIRWVPVVALGSLLGGWLGMRDATGVTPVSAVAWLVGWLAVVSWFAYLAHVARANR